MKFAEPAHAVLYYVNRSELLGGTGLDLLSGFGRKLATICTHWH